MACEERREPPGPIHRAVHAESARSTTKTCPPRQKCPDAGYGGRGQDRPAIYSALHVFMLSRGGCSAVRTGLVSCFVNSACHIICSLIRATVFATMSKLPMPEHGRAHHGRVFLFSGHMIDAPGRALPRFPEAAVTAARSAIEQVLDALQAGEHDAAICGAACGGDLLFARACLSRGMSLQLVLALDEPLFLDASVSFAGVQWTALYFDVRQHPRTTTITPDQFEPLENDQSAFERANRWQVRTAMAAPSVQFICLWDGKVGDGPGGTAHMMREIQQCGAPVHWKIGRAHV